MKKLIILLLVMLLTGYESAFTQKPGDAEPPDFVAAAKAFVGQLQTRDFSIAGESFDDTMKTAMPKAKLEETWDSLIAQAGAYKRQVSTRTEVRGAYKVVIVTTEFEKADVDIQVVFDIAQKISGLFFTPARKIVEYSPPDYVKTESFTEREVTVGKGVWELPGTLALPKGKGPFAAVVLVHGSGPNDRDETVGSQKPFRDLAWGLASKGIAVLRYEKRTKQYGTKIIPLINTFTVKEETVDDAIEAVSLLRKTENIDPKKIFVLGHSLGGMLIPRIGMRDPKIAGLISMAGAAKPLEDAILEQTIYLASTDGTVSKAEEEAIEKTKETVAKIKALEPSDTGSSDVLYGASPTYWLDLRDYDPPAAAKALKQRLLVLQGERDYQVTMKDFEKWRKALLDNENVKFRSYPKLNHLFVEGEGPMSVPAEYDLPGHMAGYVIDDIASWVMGRPVPYIRELKSNQHAQKQAPDECIAVFREFLTYVQQLEPGIVTDENAQNRWLSKAMQDSLANQIKRSGSPSESPDFPSNQPFVGVWNDPTTYSIVGSRHYDYRNEDNPDDNRAVIDVLYEWDEYPYSLQNQYPGEKALRSFIFVNEDGSWKLDDVYTFSDEYASAESLRGYFRQE